MKNYGDPTSGTTAYIGVVGTLMLIIIILFLQALYYKADLDEIQRKVIDEPSLELQEVAREQHLKLNTYDVDVAFDESNGRVIIPIGEAMRLLVEEAMATRDTASDADDNASSLAAGGGAASGEDSTP